MSKQDSAKHTPWSVDEDLETRVFVLDANGGFVAECTDGFYNDDGDWVMSGEAIQHARLIAAAPDLLQALRELFVAVDDIGNYPCREMKTARAAIARATGEQQ